MKNAWLHLVLALLFALFAIVQYNDADWYIWIPIYATVTLSSGLYYFNRNPFQLSLLIGLGVLAYAVRYVPSIISWIKMGLPTIVNEMKADQPYVEDVREFLGLLLVGLFQLYYFFKQKKRANLS